MLHSQRIWYIKPAASPEALARDLTGTPQGLDTGYELQGYLFLNDSLTTEPDRHQEYAVVKRPRQEGEPFVQVDSITATWISREGMCRVIQATLAGERDRNDWAHEVWPRLKPAFQSLREYMSALRCGEVLQLQGAERWEELVNRVSVPGQIAEVNEEMYWHFLEVLPPRWMQGSQFCYAEGIEPYRLFWRQENRYFGRQLGWDETRVFQVLGRAEHLRNLKASEQGPQQEQVTQPQDSQGESAMTKPEKSYEHNYRKLMELLGSETHRRIENEPFLPLTVEKLEGQPLISLCHYGEQNGDLMRDPEVVFLVQERTAKPVYFRNDYVGVEHATVGGYFGDVPVKPHLQKDLDGFCRMWWSNIAEQQFFEKKEPSASKTPEAGPGQEPDAGPDFEP
jgi:hypothetical protein